MSEIPCVWGGSSLHREFLDAGGSRRLKVSPAFSKAAEIQGTESLGRARRREIPGRAVK